MGWRLALRAEVARRANEARAKKLLPEEIGGHAGGQRVLRASQPSRAVEPRHPFPLRLAWREKGRRPWLRKVAGLVVLAADHHVRGARLGEFARNESGGQRLLIMNLLRDQPARRVDFGFQRGPQRRVNIV